MLTITCQSCGIKNKKTRVRCVRCGEPFEQKPAAPAPPSRWDVLRKHRGRLAIGGSALSLIALVGVISSTRGASTGASAASAPPVTQTVAGARRPKAPEKATVDPVATDPSTFGRNAYASGDYGTALERFKKAVELNPDDAEALNNLGQVLARSGNAAEAIPHFEKATRLYPNVWKYRFNLAHAHGQTGNWRQAVDDYRKAHSLFPDDYVTQFNLGMALHKLGDESSAIAEFQKGAELAPSEPSFHLSIGIGYEKLNKPAEAASAYERYLALSPDLPDADKLKARIEQLKKTV